MNITNMDPTREQLEDFFNKRAWTDDEADEPIARLSTNTLYMGMAFLCSSRSTCRRRQTGAVLIKGNRVIATGFNGAPSRIDHCTDSVCLREYLKIPSGKCHELCKALHAEENAILQCAIHGVSTVGAVLYTTNYPCSLCMKKIIQCQIEEVYWAIDYPDHYSKILAKQAKLPMHQMIFTGNKNQLSLPYYIDKI